MAELCSFCWKFIFSKDSCGSQDIIQSITLESKQMTDYYFRRRRWFFFWQTCFWQRCLKFFWKFWPFFFIRFLYKKRTKFFFQRSSPGSLDNTFLHKPCKFEQNRSSDNPRNLYYRFQNVVSRRFEINAFKVFTKFLLRRASIGKDAYG